MSINDLHKKAEESTPEHVSVPNSIIGLVTWALGRFGPVTVICTAFVVVTCYALNILYKDWKADRVEKDAVNRQLSEQVMTIAIKSTEASIASAAASVETARVMADLSSNVEKMGDILEANNRRDNAR